MVAERAGVSRLNAFKSGWGAVWVSAGEADIDGTLVSNRVQLKEVNTCRAGLKGREPAWLTGRAGAEHPGKRAGYWLWSVSE